MYYHAIDSLQTRLDTKGYRNHFRKAVHKKDLNAIEQILHKLSYTETERLQVLQVYKDYLAGRL